MAVNELVDKAIAENKVMIFSRSWCGYSRKAKQLFINEFPDVKATVFELDERDDGDEIQSYLAQKTNQTTVPNVFVNQQHVGGSDALLSLHRAGKLAPLVNQ